MRLLTYLELSGYTHAQLWELQRQMLVALPELGEGSIERENAMMNIRHIRIFLARRSYTLG